MYKIIICLCLFLMFGCNQNNDKAEIKSLKLLIENFEKYNDRKVRLIENISITNGSKPIDTLLVYNVKTLFAKRSKQTIENYLKNLAEIKSYYNLLLKVCNSEKDIDKELLNRAELLIKDYELKNDSLAYYHCLLNIVLIENDLLEINVDKIYQSDFALSSSRNVYKSTDTITLNQSYTTAIIPDNQFNTELLFNKQKDIYLEFNGKKSDLPMKVSIEAGIITVELLPKQVGNYKIKGNFKTINKDYKSSSPLNFTFRDEFFVK